MQLGVTVGMTLNLGDFQSARYELTVKDLDPAQDIEVQLKAAAPVFEYVVKALEAELYTKITGSQLVPWVQTKPVKHG